MELIYHFTPNYSSDLKPKGRYTAEKPFYPQITQMAQI